MSTPTPIEIVRETQLWRRGEGKYANIREAGAFSAIAAMPYKPEQFGEAIDAVLADAERFKALELAFEKHNSEGAISVMRWKGKCVWHYTKEPDIDGATLAELADRLREVKP